MIENVSWNLSDIEKIEKKWNVFSTFSCGGGSSMGYKMAGFNVVGANDIDPEMEWHYKKNLHPASYFLGPVKHLVSKELPEEMYRLDILDGSPPCSTFSMAGNREEDWGRERKFREGQSVQVLDELFFDFIALADKLKPKIVVAENVPGIIKGNAKFYVKKIVEKLAIAGYDTQVFLLNAKNCFVPQARERVFFVSARRDLMLPKLFLCPKSRQISVWDAIKDIQNLTSEEIRSTAPAKIDLSYWHKIKQGECYGKAHPKGSFFSHRRLCADLPAFTLTANGRDSKHPFECRMLSFREFKRLSSFPDDYIARNEKIGKYMCGMSVPPKMMCAVAEAIKLQWLS